MNNYTSLSRLVSVRKHEYINNTFISMYSEKL